MSDQTVVVRKMLPASCEEVFDAWLDSEGMRQWMCPGPVTNSVVTLEPRVGGRFRILMKSPKADYDHTGEFRVLDRPSKLQFTWVSPERTIRKRSSPSNCMNEGLSANLC